MSSQVGVRRTSLNQRRGSSAAIKKSPSPENRTFNWHHQQTLLSSSPFVWWWGEDVSDACRRTAARRVDAVLLTDSNALLSGIVTDKDISARIIAEGSSEDDPRLEKAAEQGSAIAAA
ncbi:hypothetical protein ACFX2J_039052 [Malus domestica]